MKVLKTFQGVWPGLPAAVAITLVVAFASSCGGSSAGHYQKALAIEQRLLEKGSEVTYADPGYLAVARELEQVRPWSEHRQEARALLQKIKDARRIRLNETRYLGYLPERLEGVSLASLAPPRVAADARSGVSPGKGGPSAAEAGARDPGAGSVGQVQSRASSGAKDASTQSTSRTEPAHDRASSIKEQRAARAARPPAVILYMTSWCPYCRKTSAYLKRRGVDFVAKDIEKDPKAAQELARKARGYGGVPVLDIGGTIIHGYSPEQIDAALARLGR